MIKVLLSFTLIVSSLLFEYLDLLEADKEIENGLIRSYSDLDDFRNDIKNNIPFESRNIDYGD